MSCPSTVIFPSSRKDGKWIWVEATATAIYDENNNITGYHGVSRDITERKRGELLLIERENQLRDLNATKVKLFSIIARDLRSPFNSIIGFSELLAKHTKSSATLESEMYLDYIQSSAKQTLTLLENLLIWAKSQTGQNPFNPVAINLSMMIRYAVDLSRSAANLKKIKLNYIETDQIEVFADMNMLNTILRNLISNAIKYSHEQLVLVSFTRHRASTPEPSKKKVLFYMPSMKVTDPVVAWINIRRPTFIFLKTKKVFGVFKLLFC